MDEGERKKKPSSLPPDYVSLAQLRERWLKKRQEEKLKEVEKQNAENQKQSEVTDGTMETDGGQMGIIDEEIEKGKGKEIQQNGVENKNKKKKKKIYRKKKHSLVDDNRENHKGEDLPGAISEEAASVSMVEVLPGNGDKHVPNVKAARYKSRFQKNGNKEYRVKLHEAKDYEEMSLEKKVVGEKGKRKKWGNKRRTCDNRDKNSRSENSAAEIHGSKGNEVGLNSEEMIKREILEAGVKLDCLKVIDDNGSVGGEGLNDNQIALEKKTQDEKSVENTVKDDEKGEAENGNVGRKFGRSAFSGLRSSGHVRSRMDMIAVGNRNYASSGRFGGRKMKQRDSGMVWVKKEDKSGANAVEVGSTGISLDQELPKPAAQDRRM